ncbi:MAG: hypothetical protein RRC34_16915 [Lentisphaeria bacterium]|nr:hypothetical protein [Lentisphaeria bacterium]
MEALREITHIQGRKLTLTVPSALDNRDVEVIILPVEIAAHFPRSTPASQRGSLHKFSNPEKMTEEKAVWAASAGEKHASH